MAILAKATLPILTRRGLPGDPDDSHSRYIEAAVDGILIGCLYLPNGNPAPGPKFDYKLRWFKRLQNYAAELLAFDIPVALIGDFNVMPTDLDVYAPERWRDDALFRPEVRRAYAELVAQGWTDAIRELHPDERIYTFWKYWRNAELLDPIRDLIVLGHVGPRTILRAAVLLAVGRDSSSVAIEQWRIMCRGSAALERFDALPDPGVPLLISWSGLGWPKEIPTTANMRAAGGLRPWKNCARHGERHAPANGRRRPTRLPRPCQMADRCRS